MSSGVAARLDEGSFVDRLAHDAPLVYCNSLQYPCFLDRIPMAEKRASPRASPKPVRSALVGDAFADIKGRGARSNRESRFLQAVHEVDPEFLEHERLSVDANERDPGKPNDGEAPLEAPA